MNKNVGIILGIIVVVGVGLFLAGDKTVERDVNGGNGAPESEAVVEERIVTTDSGSYEDYGVGKVALANEGKVVLFFHASWCPSCRALNSDIEANAATIPAGVTILKTDYDKETELKKKYGVTTQHALVQVDGDGNMITKWSGGSKLENVLSQLQ
jgi:thiol-disulfide isomerase/thioredoxin